MAALRNEAAGAPLDAPATAAAAVAVTGRAATPPRGGAGGGSPLPADAQGDASQPSSANSSPPSSGGEAGGGGKTAGDGAPQQRVFFVEGPVDPRQHFVVNRDAWHAELAEKLCRGSYVLLHAHRQGGKSSGARAVRSALWKRRQQGYVVLYLSMQRATKSSPEALWRSLATAVRERLPNTRRWPPHDAAVPALAAGGAELPFTNSDSFQGYFSSLNWGDRRVVLVLDEFDTLLDAPVEVRDSVLGALRDIRSDNSVTSSGEDQPYALHALLAIGVYRIVNLSAATASLASPFNVASAITPPDPTPDDVRAMFHAYDNEYGVRTAADVVDDIIWRAGGHVGLLSLMGQELVRLHEAAAAASGRAAVPTVDLAAWLAIVCSDELYSRINMSPTVRVMLQHLRSPSAPAGVVLRARELVRHLLAVADGLKLRAGHPDTTVVHAVEYLLSEGVIVEDSTSTCTHRITAPLLRDLLCGEVGSVYGSSIPREVPLKERSDGAVDLVATVMELLQHFSFADLFHRFEVKADGSPCEYAYHFQLHALLKARLGGMGWTVLGETRNSAAGGQPRRLDIYLQACGRAYGIELLVGADRISQHVLDQAPTYAVQQLLERVLVLNFSTTRASIPAAPETRAPPSVEEMHVLVNKDACTMTPYVLRDGAFVALHAVKARHAATEGDADVAALAAQMAATNIITPAGTPARGAAASANPAGGVGAARVRLCLDVGGGNLIEWRAAADATVEATVAECAAILPAIPAAGPPTALVRRVGAAFRLQRMAMVLTDLVGERDLFIRHGVQDFPLSVE
jgi:hypothetical protein